MKQFSKLPLEFVNYIHERISKNVEGGRPHFLSLLVKRGRDSQEDALTICEQAWIKNRSLGLIARDYGTNRKTIYRLLKDLESVKTQLANYLKTTSRRKRWFSPELNSSDFETVQNYIKRARRDGLKRYRDQIQFARKAWTFLGCRDPQYWTADEVCEYLSSLSKGTQSRMLDSIRQVAPHLRDEVKTGRFREKLGRHKKDIFANEVKMIHKALESEKEFSYLETILDLHVTLGAREGSTDPDSGLAGLTWDKFKKDFSKVDLYESKVRGGITWRDCPLDLFFKDLPGRLKTLWNERDKPSGEKVLRNGYKELIQIYKTIRNILGIYYQDHADPSLLQEFITLKPHDARAIEMLSGILNRTKRIQAFD